MIGAVMTCPQREHSWPVVVSRWPGWPLVIDDGCGIVENFCRAMERAAETAANGWAVMAQDDVEPIAGLAEGLPRVLASAPSDASCVAFFSLGRTRDAEEVAAGIRWRKRRRRELLWVMLLAMRSEVVRDATAGVRRVGLSKTDDRVGIGKTDDGDLRRWLDASGTIAYTHLPSLVQHVGKVSVLGHGWTIGGRSREAPTFPVGRHLDDVCPP
jgi:hypothetical protein